MTNSDLKDVYEKIYQEGAYQNFYTFSAIEETAAIAAGDGWPGKRVLEIGCGEGDLAAVLAERGAEVLAVDYVKSAIDIAVSKYQHPNLMFRYCDYMDVAGAFDIVVMQGVLEHMDEPFVTLQTISSKLLKRPGKIVTSSPSFLNPRGYIWMALQLLLEVPMSLSDTHFLCPFDFEEYAKKLGAYLSYRSIDQDWGHGERLIVDFQKRLRNAFRDRGLKADVDGFLNWLSKTLNCTTYNKFSGANIVYEFTFEA